jgi:hypothetical protein
VKIRFKCNDNLIFRIPIYLWRSASNVQVVLLSFFPGIFYCCSRVLCHLIHSALVWWSETLGVKSISLFDGSYSPIAEVVTGGVMKEGKLRTNSWWFTFINFNGVIHPEYGYLLNTNVEYDPSKRLIDLTPNVSDHLFPEKHIHKVWLNVSLPCHVCLTLLHFIFIFSRNFLLLFSCFVPFNYLHLKTDCEC